MDMRDNGAAARRQDRADRDEIEGGRGRPGGADEQLEGELAAFAFLREDDERETRLYFRDVPADDLAVSFRRAGAIFITMTGERARLAQPPPTPPVPIEADSGLDPPVEEPRSTGKRRRKRRPDPTHHAAQADIPRSLGELTVRYFYAVESMVYTLIITSSTGIMASIANIFPAAGLQERELQTRLTATFR